MTLKKFVHEFVCSSSLIRLWFPDGRGDYIMIYKDDVKKPGNVDDVCMSWELLGGAHWLSKYGDYEVVGVKDIYVDNSFYKEAINIVIKEL